MSLESGLFGLLSGDAGVSAIVATRIYPLVLPQDVVYPAISYGLLDSNFNYVFGTEAPKIVEPFFQVSCWTRPTVKGGTGAAGCSALAEAAKLVLQHQAGSIGGVTVLAFLLENEFGSYDSVAKVHFRHIRFRVLYE